MFADQLEERPSGRFEGIADSLLDAIGGGLPPNPEPRVLYSMEVASSNEASAFAKKAREFPEHFRRTCALDEPHEIYFLLSPQMELVFNVFVKLCMTTPDEAVLVLFKLKILESNAKWKTAEAMCSRYLRRGASDLEFIDQEENE